MKRSYVLLAVVVALTIMAAAALARQSQQSSGPYKVLKTVKVGGDGGFDYVNADPVGRRLYVARSGTAPRISVYDLDTLALVGEIPNTGGHGAMVDPKTNHGFSTSKPLTMFDSKTLTVIKTIDVQGNPDGMLFDAFNQRYYDLSHMSPHVTVVDTKDGSVVGTFDIGGAPEQAVSDGKGHIYIDVEDMGNIAVVDAKTMKVTAHYDISSKGGTCAGLALDVKNQILFSTCRMPQTMVILSAKDGKIITSLPIGTLSDGAVFNPATKEAFSSQNDGTLTIVKENSPKSFEVEQTVQTMPSAKTLTLDPKTGHILLIAGEFTPPPSPPPAGGRGGRGQLIPGSFSIIVVGK